VFESTITLGDFVVGTKQFAGHQLEGKTQMVEKRRNSKNVIPQLQLTQNL
jgi:hypothetical protein